jgi:myo-inositol 2-dehydrogenase / D-chiro-inositol 1-dehydrogenase
MALRIGIIGCGYIGNVHARNLLADDRVRITAVNDIIASKAEDLASVTGARVHPNIQSMISSGLDAIYVCTPNAIHADFVLAALAAGVNVFSEKPMATSLDVARQIVAASRSSKALYQVGHNRRFANVYKFIKSTLQSGFRPVAAHVKMNRGELKNPVWTGDPKISGGFLYETPIHLFDMMRWLMGDVQGVQCLARQSVYTELDGFSILFTFSDHRHGTFTTVAHTTWAFPFERIELYSDHAQIATEEMEAVTYAPGLGQDMVSYHYNQVPFPQKWGYIEEDRLFIDSVLGGKPPAVSADDGYRAVELAEAIYRSARMGGERVELPLPYAR